MARAIKENTGLKVIGVGGIKDPETGEKILDRNFSDMTAIGRAILADHQWAQKTVEGREGNIMKCVGCKSCFWYSTPEKCPVQKKLRKAKLEV